MVEVADWDSCWNSSGKIDRNFQGTNQEVFPDQKKCLGDSFLLPKIPRIFLWEQFLDFSVKPGKVSCRKYL